MINFPSTARLTYISHLPDAPTDRMQGNLAMLDSDRFESSSEADIRKWLRAKGVTGRVIQHAFNCLKARVECFRLIQNPLEQFKHHRGYKDVTFESGRWIVRIFIFEIEMTRNDIALMKIKRNNQRE